MVPRHAYVDVRYQRKDSSWVEGTHSDFLARVFQHYYNHLEGTL